MSQRVEGQIDYIEISTTDISGCKRFFSAMFGWSFKDFGADYTCFNDGRLQGGFCRSPSSSSDGSVLLVFYAEDLAAYLTKAKSLGAVITKDIFAFPGGRRFQFSVPGCGEFSVWSDR